MEYETIAACEFFDTSSTIDEEWYQFIEQRDYNDDYLEDCLTANGLDIDLILS